MIFSSKPIKFSFKPNTPKLSKELEAQGDHVTITTMKPLFGNRD